ncbi:MAG: polysulfide reductase NrfD [Chloroflexi bacterium]|nr:polysulfide reductase NrfD [Chloroflexota bacterium]
MQDRRVQSPTEVNYELLEPVIYRTPRMVWVLMAALGLGLLTGLLTFGLVLIYGWGLGGQNRPIMWGILIANFVFWIGISHAGVMISAILRLTQAEWRRPVTRAAEVLTAFALATAALQPVLHAGRPWRILYWVFPYDFFRGIWPNVRSPLVWDPSAIFTYLTGTILFVYVAMIPDLAIMRDRSTGWQRAFYGAMALGWRGNPRQWRLQGVVGILLSALMLPVFVSVHSIVSWDFAVSLVPIWHATVFAPYFVIGAVHSGVSSVATLMALMRWIFKWENHIRPEHFDALGRLLVAVASAWMFYFLLDVFFAIYSGEPAELAVMERRFFEWPFNVMLAVIFIFGYFVPIPLWLSGRVRRNIPLMFVTSLLVNIAMWMERYWLVIPGLELKERLAYNYVTYTPSVTEIVIVVASFAQVGLLVLLFAKLFPLIPVWEAKEGQVLAAEIQIGKRKVPALIKE